MSTDRAGSEALRAITSDRIRQHVFFLASDSLKGRDTPSPGLEMAAKYVANEFRTYGFQPVNGSHFAEVKLNIVSLGDENELRITSGKTERSFEIKTEYTPFDMTANKTATGPIVFAGYGITSTEHHYDDYGGVDVKGKIVLVMRHEPGENDTGSVFGGTRATEYSNVSEKVRIALEHGATALLVVTDPRNHTSLAPRGFPWPSLSKFLPKDALPITLAGDDENKIPVVHVGEEVIAQLFGSLDSLKNLQTLIDSRVLPLSFELATITAYVKTSTSIKDMSASNVVGVLEGSDPVLKNEYVIIGAHYDHVGSMKNSPPGTDGIFNGADDNASGTSAVLAIAAAFGSAPIKPKRSVVVMAFSAEEKGLLGSQAYVNHPLFPLEKTVAMFNLDMVGRNSIDSLMVVAPVKSPDLAALVREENKIVGFVLGEDYAGSGGSDHATFMRKNIPFLFLFSGFHPQYHQVTDHADLINVDKIARVATLAFRTAWRVANEDKKYRLTQ